MYERAGISPESSGETIVSSKMPKILQVAALAQYSFEGIGFESEINKQIGLHCCGVTTNAHHLFNLVQNQKPHVAIVDADAFGEKEVPSDFIKKMRTTYIETQILAISKHDEWLRTKAVLQKGAKGFLMKTATVDEMMNAIRLVAKGEIAITKKVQERLLGEQLHERPAGDVGLLAERELQVFVLIGRGLTTKQVAAQLILSPKTIETYREKIKHKLGLNNAAELTRAAIDYVLGLPKAS